MAGGIAMGSSAGGVHPVVMLAIPMFRRDEQQPTQEVDGADAQGVGHEASQAMLASLTACHRVSSKENTRPRRRSGTVACSTEL